MLQNDGIKIRDFTNRDIPKFFIGESMQNQNEKWMKWCFMKTNLDKIDYENIYNYSLEEYESVMDFLQLTAEFQTAVSQSPDLPAHQLHLQLLSSLPP